MTLRQPKSSAPHDSVGSQYWLGFADSLDDKSATYDDGRSNLYTYDSTYFSALTVDERDQYNPKKYFFNELKDVVSTTPAHLVDAASLYREDNAFSGNLITVQRFYQLPFSVDLHFGYRDSPWTPEEMDTTKVTNSL